MDGKFTSSSPARLPHSRAGIASVVIPLLNLVFIILGFLAYSPHTTNPLPCIAMYVTPVTGLVGIALAVNAYRRKGDSPTLPLLGLILGLCSGCANGYVIFLMFAMR